jgi:tripartite-type tricarboxylate transporter receptor subunit TctC
MKRNLALAAALALSAATATVPAALAQNYPSKPIEVIVPFSPGGTSDILGRILAHKLADEFKATTVTVLNKPGAGGNVGTAQYSKAAPDGHTLVMAYVGTISINPSLYGDKLPYDPEKGLVPVAPMASLPMFLVVHPSVPAQNLAEFVKLAKSKPGKLTFSSAGNGGSNHLAGELLATVAGVEMLHVPYNGSAPALNALLGGHVSWMFDSGRVLPHIKENKLRVLAVSTSKRLPKHLDIPAVAETFPGFDAVSWHGVFAPAGTPKPIVERLNALVSEALSSPQVKQQLANVALEPFVASPDEFARFIRAETDKWSGVVRKSGAKVD